MRKILFAGVLLIGMLVSVVHGEVVTQAHTEVELVSEVKSIQPGSKFWIGLRMKHEPEWHTYWKNPGDSGLATSIDWRLPPSLKAGPILWPLPSKIVVPLLISYGYEGETLLPIEFEMTSSGSSVQEVEIAATVKWLACKESCVPGKAQLHLTLPVSKDAPLPDERWLTLFSNARNQLPLKQSNFEIHAQRCGENLCFEFVSSGAIEEALSGVEFFPDDAHLIQHAAKQIWMKQGKGAVLSVPLVSGVKFPDRVSGVLISEKGWRGPDSEKALEIDLKIEKEGKTTSSSPIFYFLLAFLGGMILNLMPCVLPVLSLKILGFIHQAEESALKPYWHGLMYSFGVILSFWILAGVMIFFRSAGEEIGWGFQLQSQPFLIGLIFVFFVMALNFFGVFEIGYSLANVGNRSSARGLSGAFFGGVLATLVATPCTAPFMGTALGFAVSQSYAVAFGVFSFLGAGMAMPYFLLTLFPKLLRFLPKPGPWMNTLKQFFGFILLATVIWMLSILTLQAEGFTATGVLFGLWFAGMALWIFGRGVNPETSLKRKIISVWIASLLFGAGLYQSGLFSSAKMTGSESARLDWQPYSEESFQRALSTGKPVFIDFTAAWCLTCQVNERVALNSREVVQKFMELEIIPLKADWTSRNPEITQALSRYGRNSIPLYVLYGKKGESPVILPEVITPGMVLENLKKLEDKRKG
jgi:thiol:disulfide interchange protein/DsbC/DsbD-like thiol-disulfide interchange protein